MKARVGTISAEIVADGPQSNHAILTLCHEPLNTERPVTFSYSTDEGLHCSGSYTFQDRQDGSLARALFAPKNPNLDDVASVARGIRAAARRLVVAATPEPPPVPSQMAEPIT